MRWRRLPPADVEACCRAQHAAGGRAASGANGGADSQSSGARAASAAARGRGARAAGPCWLVCSLACATAFFLCLYLLCRCTCLTWFNPGVMGDAGDWCTVSRLSYALEAATNAARGDGALLAEMLALPAPDTSALARRGKDGDAGPQSEGVASSGLAWAVAVGTMHEGDSQALRTALASIALRSAVRTVLVLLDEALPQSALDQALTPELRRCLDLKVLPVDPLACTNADEAHTQRYHGTYMRFHLFGMVQYRRIVYVDVDMLVGSRAMDSLFTFEMPPGKELAAARFSNGDCYGGRFGTCSDEVLYDHGFFNAGMLVIQPDHQLFLELLLAYRRYTARAWALRVFPPGVKRYCVTSQPTLVRFFAMERRSVFYLPVAFNFWPRRGRELPAVAIAPHFIGTEKPWHAPPWELATPLHAEWWRLANASEPGAMPVARLCDASGGVS